MVAKSDGVTSNRPVRDVRFPRSRPTRSPELLFRSPSGPHTKSRFKENEIVVLRRRVEMVSLSPEHGEGWRVHQVPYPTLHAYFYFYSVLVVEV